MLPLTANADILGFSKSIFTNFKSIIFLLLGVFIAIWLLDIFIGKFNDWVRSPTRITTNVEKNEIHTLVRIGRARGYNLNPRKIMSDFSTEKENILLTKLAKKYGVHLSTGAVAEGQSVKIKVKKVK